MINNETAHTFIKKFFEENPTSDYYACTRAFAKHFEIKFSEAYAFVSTYASKKWKV